MSESPWEQALKVCESASILGFDPPFYHDAVRKVQEECSELLEAISIGIKDEMEEEAADVLFASFRMVWVIFRENPADLIQRATRKFDSRLFEVQCIARRDETEMKRRYQYLDGAWQKVKAIEKESKAILDKQKLEKW